MNEHTTVELFLGEQSCGQQCPHCPHSNKSGISTNQNLSVEQIETFIKIQEIISQYSGKSPGAGVYIYNTPDTFENLELPLIKGFHIQQLCLSIGDKIFEIVKNINTNKIAELKQLANTILHSAEKMLTEQNTPYKTPLKILSNIQYNIFSNTEKTILELENNKLVRILFTYLYQYVFMQIRKLKQTQISSQELSFWLAANSLNISKNLEEEFFYFDSFIEEFFNGLTHLTGPIKGIEGQKKHTATTDIRYDKISTDIITMDPIYNDENYFRFLYQVHGKKLMKDKNILYTRDINKGKHSETLSLYPDSVQLYHGSDNVNQSEFIFSHQEFRILLDSVSKNKSLSQVCLDAISNRGIEIKFI